jgi:polysaccharide biosynthesis transport protein
VVSEVKSFQDIIDIVRRRRLSIAIPAAVIFLIAAITAISLPRIYRSTATMLIEAQDVPNEYVRANITSFADQRLQTINQRIMGTPKLLELINRFKLYADMKDRLTTDEIVEKMRKKDIQFNTISADVIDPRSGNPAKATIAFSVSFQSPSPEAAQQVANELSSLYIEENLKGREQQSQGTSNFLSEELKQIQASLADVEGRIAAFKQRNINTLPELTQINMQVYDQADRDIRQLTDQLRTAKEKEEALQSQLANTSSELSSTEKENLKQLKMRLIDLQSRYSDNYPDVAKTKAEIREAERQLKASNLDSSGAKGDNPAYVTLASQRSGIQSEIASLKRQIADLARKRDSYQGRIFATPRVEEGYKTLMVQRNNLQLKYDELSSKSMQAKVAHGMEKEQLGERFTLVDPARVPDRPSSPNVPAILLIGLILGIGSGVGLAAIREAGDQAVRSADELALLTGLPVLATIPEIVTVKDIRGNKRNWLVFLGAAALALVVVIALFHFFVMDLDIFVAKVSRKITAM